MNDTTVTPAATTDKAVFAAIAAATANPSSLDLFKSLDRSGRARVRSAIETTRNAIPGKADPTSPESVVEAFAEFNRLGAVLEAMKSTKSTKKVDIDPVVQVADRIATLRLAADLLESGMAAPDGLEPVDFGDESVRDYVTKVDVQAAYAYAEARVGRSAPTFKVEDGLRAAFDGQPVGTVLTVREAAKAWAAAGGPDKADGRISARVFAESGCTIDFVEPVPATADTVKSIRLIQAV